MSHFMSLLLFTSLLALAQPKLTDPVSALGTYELPISEHVNRENTIRYRTCEIVVTESGGSRYMIVDLAAYNAAGDHLYGGGNLSIATVSQNQIVYEFKYSSSRDGLIDRTELSLDPNTKKVIRARLTRTNVNGSVLRLFTCGEIPQS